LEARPKRRRFVPDGVRLASLRVFHRRGTLAPSDGPRWVGLGRSRLPLSLGHRDRQQV
jgi:hypothetical protein